MYREHFTDSSPSQEKKNKLEHGGQTLKGSFEGTLISLYIAWI